MLRCWSASSAACPLVTGVRRLLQDEPPGFVTDRSVVAGVRLLAGYGLSMDLCVRQHQLGEVVDLVDRCPEVLFVLDHLGKPRVTNDGLRALGDGADPARERPNVRCKLSGLDVRGARPVARTSSGLRRGSSTRWPPSDPSRCMFGSDWPVLSEAARPTASGARSSSDAIAGLPDGAASVSAERHGDRHL